mgnify:FL=1
MIKKTNGMFAILKKCIAAAFELSVYDSQLYKGWSMMEEEGILEREVKDIRLGEFVCPYCAIDELVNITIRTYPEGRKEFRISDYADEDTYHCGSCDEVYKINRMKTDGHIKDITVP